MGNLPLPCLIMREYLRYDFRACSACLCAKKGLDSGTSATEPPKLNGWVIVHQKIPPFPTFFKSMASMDFQHRPSQRVGQKDAKDSGSRTTSTHDGLRAASCACCAWCPCGAPQGHGIMVGPWWHGAGNPKGFPFGNSPSQLIGGLNPSEKY